MRTRRRRSPSDFPFSPRRSPSSAGPRGPWSPYLLAVGVTLVALLVGTGLVMRLLPMLV